MMFFIFAWVFTTTVLLTTAFPQPNLVPRTTEENREYLACLTKWVEGATGFPTIWSVYAAEKACYNAVVKKFKNAVVERYSAGMVDALLADLREDLMDSPEIYVPPPGQGDTPEEDHGGGTDFNLMTRIQLPGRSDVRGVLGQMKSYMFGNGGDGRPGIGSPARRVPLLAPRPF